MKNKIFTRIIITTLLCAFLTLNVGKVTRVSAVGTTAAIAGTAFILTGAVYISYLALTQSQIALPAVDDLNDWLGNIGRKVSQYPSGADAYSDIYQGLLFPVGNVIDGVWTWTEDRIKSFANDFSDTRIIQNIVSFERVVDTYYEISTPYNYSAFNILPPPTNVRYNGNTISLAQFISYGFDLRPAEGAKVLRNLDGNDYYIVGTNITTPVRNLLRDGLYTAQTFVNGSWTNANGLFYTSLVYESDLFRGNITNAFSADYYTFSSSQGYNFSAVNRTYPPFTQADIYDEANDVIIPATDITPVEHVTTPTWVDPDNENRPIIPWVPIPNLPTGLPTPPGYTGTPQWGFPLQDLLDLLEELARTLIDIGTIGELINQFAGLHGDEYYLSYNEGDTNYYTYYQPTIYDNDTEYVTYNINVSDDQDTIPVNLNTISQYSNNRYLEQIKQSAINGSSIVRDFAVFWYDVDPEVTYIALGICVLILLGAFTGKLGHS